MKIRGDMGIADFMGRMGVEVWGGDTDRGGGPARGRR